MQPPTTAPTKDYSAYKFTEEEFEVYFQRLYYGPKNLVGNFKVDPDLVKKNKLFWKKTRHPNFFRHKPTLEKSTKPPTLVQKKKVVKLSFPQYPERKPLFLPEESI